MNIINIYKRFCLQKKKRMFYKYFTENIKGYYLMPFILQENKNQNEKNILCIVNKISEIKGYIIDINSKKTFNIEKLGFPVFYVDFNKKDFTKTIEEIKKCLKI